MEAASLRTLKPRGLPREFWIILLAILRMPLALLVNSLGVSVLVRENLLQSYLSFPLLEILKKPSIDRFAALNEPVVLGILKFLSKGL